MRRFLLSISALLLVLLPNAPIFAQTEAQCISRATSADESCKQQVELQVALTCTDDCADAIRSTCGSVDSNPNYSSCESEVLATDLFCTTRQNDAQCITRTRTNGLATCASRLETALDACYEAASTCSQQGEQVYRDCINAESTTTVEQCETLRDQKVRACNTAGASSTTDTPEVDQAITAAQQAAAASASQSAFARTYDQVMSQGIIFANICDSRTAICECRDNGDCEISDILQVAVNVVNFIIAISGSLVLAMFIYGGVLWVFSAGNEGTVKKGQDIIEGAVIGLIIILGSYAAVAIIVSILTKDEAVRDGTNLEDLTGGSELFNTENP